jgi:hypothetical protein
MKKRKVRVTNTGYLPNSPDRHNPMNIIPSNQITMDTVPFPILGIDNMGNRQMMMPGMDYTFPGQYVTEIPMGKYQEGGSNFKTKLSAEEEEQFKKFFQTLPDNLRADDSMYDIRGYWDASGRPEEFDYSEPTQEDGYYHAFSRHPETGKILKAPTHPTFNYAVDKTPLGDDTYVPLIGVDGNVYMRDLNWDAQQAFEKDTYQKGGPKQREVVYTNPEEFKIANQAYADSLAVYNSPETSHKYYSHINNLIANSKFEEADRLLNMPLPSAKNYKRLTILNNQEPTPISGSPFLLGFDPKHSSTPKYKKPETKPVLQEVPLYIEPRPLSKLPIPEPKLATYNIPQLPQRETKPVMRSSSAHRTGQYQIGEDTYNPKTKKWERKLFKDEEADWYRNQNLIKKQKGGLAKYQKKGQVTCPEGYYSLNGKCYLKYPFIDLQDYSPMTSSPDFDESKLTESQRDMIQRSKAAIDYWTKLGYVQDPQYNDERYFGHRGIKDWFNNFTAPSKYGEGNGPLLHIEEGVEPDPNNPNIYYAPSFDTSHIFGKNENFEQDPNLPKLKIDITDQGFPTDIVYKDGTEDFKRGYNVIKFIHPDLYNNKTALTKASEEKHWCPECVQEISERNPSEGYYIIRGKQHSGQGELRHWTTDDKGTRSEKYMGSVLNEDWMSPEEFEKFSQPNADATYNVQFDPSKTIYKTPEAAYKVLEDRWRKSAEQKAVERRKAEYEKIQKQKKQGGIYLGEYEFRNGGLVKMENGGPKEKGWREYKTPTGESLYLDPRFKDQRYYVNEKGDHVTPDQNISLYDVTDNVWESGTSMPALEVSPKYKYVQRPGALGAMETVRVDLDNGTQEITSPDVMATKREMDSFANSFNPAGLVVQGVGNIAQGNLAEGALQTALSVPIVGQVLGKAIAAPVKFAGKEIAQTYGPALSEVGRLATTKTPLKYASQIIPSKFKGVPNNKGILSDYRDIEQLRIAQNSKDYKQFEKYHTFKNKKSDLFLDEADFNKAKNESNLLIKKYKPEFEKKFGKAADDYEILLYGAHQDLKNFGTQKDFLARSDDPLGASLGLNNNPTNDQMFLGDAYQQEFSEYFNNHLDPRSPGNRNFAKYLFDEFEPVITANKVNKPVQVKRTSSFNRPVKTVRDNEEMMLHYDDLQEGDVIYPEHNWSTSTDLDNPIWGSDRSKVARINIPENQSVFRPNRFSKLNNGLNAEQEIVLPSKLGYKVVGTNPQGIGDDYPRFIFDVANPYKNGGIYLGRYNFQDGGLVKYQSGGPKDKNWKEYKTPTGESLYLDPRFKNQRYYVNEKGDHVTPDQNMSLFDVENNIWESGTSLPTLEVSPKYKYVQRPGSLGSMETTRIDLDNGSQEVTSPDVMATKREMDAFANATINPAGLLVTGVGNIAQGNIGQGLTEVALSHPLVANTVGRVIGAPFKFAGKQVAQTYGPALSEVGQYLTTQTPLKNVWKFNPPVEVPKPTSSFKSEIDWGKWNSEIPSNKALMDEYHIIEQTSKANGTWMKNADGTPFDGTPEEFVYVNSSNFKKNFPNGAETIYKGVGAQGRITKMRSTDEEHVLPFFAGDKNIGKQFTSKYHTDKSPYISHNNTKFNPEANAEVHKFYYPKDVDPIVIDANKGHWGGFKLPENAISGDEKYQLLKEALKGNANTASLQQYVKDNNLSYITIKNLIEKGNSTLGTVYIINPKMGRFAKSAIGNNGMIDMSNPNIYKGLIPYIGAGYLGEKLYDSQQQKKPILKKGGLIKAQEGRSTYFFEPTYIKGDDNEQPRYDPTTKNIYYRDMGSDAETNAVLEHERYHWMQDLEGGLHVNTGQGPVKRPVGPVTDEHSGNYYNRLTEDVNQIGSGFIQQNPSFQFVPEDVIYSNYIFPVQYEIPWTVEGEARNYEKYIRSGGKSIFKKQGGSVRKVKIKRAPRKNQ